jgi:DNA-directed RNA polymerase subunit alpha
MHSVHDIIGVPKITEKVISSDGMLESEFHIAPFPPGYGMTIGNSLRRVCLSSVPGTKVTGIKVKGVTHEYTTLPGIKHSILEIMLNLKDVVVEKNDSGIAWLQLTKNKAGAVTAKDINTPSDIKIHNPDLIITEIDQDGFEISMEIRIEKNVGYKSIEELKDEEDDVNVLLIDANFSPVLNMSYDVKSSRYGDMTDLDELIMNIKTNGMIKPKDAIQFGANMLGSYYNMFGVEGLQVE